jgi:two-component system phosphate regulon sensor histidine kinase PhoR
MIEAIPFPALLIDPSDIVIAANAGAEALFGRDIRGRPYGMFLRQPQILAAMAQVVAGEQPEPTPDAPYLVHVRGSQDGMLIVWQDQSEADALSQMRRDFVANVSHELRTPLTSLMGFIETLTGQAGDDPAARTRFLGIMDREARRMNRLIGDLLSLSSVESNERVRPRTPVDLGDLVRSVVAGPNRKARVASQ